MTYFISVSLLLAAAQKLRERFFIVRGHAVVEAQQAAQIVAVEPDMRVGSGADQRFCGERREPRNRHV